MTCDGEPVNRAHGEKREGKRVDSREQRVRGLEDKRLRANAVNNDVGNLFGFQELKRRQN